MSVLKPLLVQIKNQKKDIKSITKNMGRLFLDSQIKNTLKYLLSSKISNFRETILKWLFGHFMMGIVRKYF